MARAELQNLSGHPLLVTDLARLTPDEAAAVLEMAHLLATQQPREGRILSLLLVHGLRIDPRLVDRMREIGRLGAPWVRATAFAGVSALGRIVIRATAPFTGRKVGAFDTEEEAKRWLLAQTDKAG